MTKKNKIVVGSIIGGVVVLGGIGAVINGNNNLPEDKIFTVNELCTECKNDDSFDLHHRDEVVTVSATIENDRDISFGTLHLYSTVEHDTYSSNYSLLCKFDNASDIEHLGAGDEIVLSGSLNGVLTTSITLKECTLISYTDNSVETVEKSNDESLDTEVQTTSAENETSESEIPPRDTATGKSDKSVDGLITIKATSVRNDKTGNWRYSAFSESGLDISEYALSYYNEYFESDSEIHAVVNFADKTTTRISYTSGMLFVTVLEYVDGEEHDAALLFSGDVISDYIVYTDNGDIEALDTPDTETVHAPPETTPATTVTTPAPQTTPETTTSTTAATTPRTTTYVLNTSTKKIHRSSCRDVKKIDPENYATTDDFDKALSDGYTTCGHCF